MDERERAEAVARAAAGDADALQRLIVHYHATLLRFIEARTEPGLGRYIEPDDILQEAYVAAFKRVRDCRFEGPGGFYKWLETIALNELRDVQRALRRRKRDLARRVQPTAPRTASHTTLLARLSASDSTPSRQLARREAAVAVLSCLARLSDDQRAVVRLRFLEDVPVSEVARRLGKTETAVYMLCHRGLKSLRELMASITDYLTRL